MSCKRMGMGTYVAGETFEVVCVSERSYELSSQMTAALPTDTRLLSAGTTRAIVLILEVVSVPEFAILSSHCRVPRFQTQLVSMAAIGIGITITERGIGRGFWGGVIC